MTLINGVAVVIVGFYLVGLAVLFLFWNGANDVTWTRAVYVAGGVEAIAFAAAGYLFGKEVHREQAEQANTRANDAQRERATEQTRADTATTNGRALRAQIGLKGQKATQTYGGLGPQAATVSTADLAELQQLADKLFP